jgi:hypothetical protein
VGNKGRVEAVTDQDKESEEGTDEKHLGTMEDEYAEREGGAWHQLGFANGSLSGKANWYMINGCMSVELMDWRNDDFVGLGEDDTE